MKIIIVIACRDLMTLASPGLIFYIFGPFLFISLHDIYLPPYRTYNPSGLRIQLSVGQMLVGVAQTLTRTLDRYSRAVLPEVCV